MSGVRHALLLVGLAAAFLLPPATVQAQSASKSEELVKELARLTAEKQLQFVAAKHAKEADRFVAAMVMPGIQIVAISARYEPAEALVASLAEGKYQDIYMDLSAAAVAGSRIFIEDVAGNGLVARPDDNQPFDIMEKGQDRTEFTGNWRKMKMEEAAYMVLFSEAEGQYSAILEQLIAQLKK